MPANAAQRAWSHGPAPQPYTRPRKVSPQQRDEIRTRLADGEKPADLAQEYGVAAATIRGCR